MRNIDLSHTLDDLERILRVCAEDSRSTPNALAVLRRWQGDEQLDDSLRERARRLVEEFS
ncbi:MAG: hypothetical protein ACE5I7_07160 [Candidatus Binatia bacterium]